MMRRDNLAAFHLELDDAFELIGNAQYSFQFTTDPAFPTHVLFQVQGDRLSKGSPTSSPTLAVMDEIVPGLTGRLFPQVASRNDAETFIFQVEQVDVAARRMVAQMIKPQYVPISLSLPRVISNPAMGNLTPPTDTETPQWPIVQTLRGLEIPHDVQLSENIRLVQLPRADIFELQYQLGDVYKVMQFWFWFTHALCFQTLPVSDEEVLRILTALALFRPGYIERSASFNWGIGMSSQQLIFQQRPYNLAYPKYILQATDVSGLVEWVAFYRALSIDPNSVMARALTRFARTYDYAADFHERITDAVIGLETLIAPAQDSDTTYRVAQRVSFLVADQLEDRLVVYERIRTAYSTRNDWVHSSLVKKKADETLAADCQEYLRSAIRRILRAGTEVRDLFCQPTSDEKRKSMETLYTHAIFLGEFDQAVRRLSTPS